MDVVKASVPVTASDAQRTEALGPPLAMLLLQLLPMGGGRIEGDSQYIMGVLDGRYLPKDVFLYNCSQMTIDLTGNRGLAASWIQRDLNEICDGLAR